MHWTTHIITGANLGRASDNPALGGSLGFLSHVFLDAIPHHDPDQKIGYVIDSVLGVLILLFLKEINRSGVLPNSSSVISGAFFSAMPDLELVVKVFTDAADEHFFFPTHNGEIHHLRITFWKSLLLEALIVILSFLAYRHFRNRRGLNNPKNLMNARYHPDIGKNFQRL